MPSAERHHATTVQWIRRGALLFAQARGTILTVQLHPFGWLSLVLSKSIQWAPYLQRNIVVPLTGSHHHLDHGPWSIPPRTAPGRQGRELAHNALDLEPGQSSFWGPDPCSPPFSAAEPQTVVHDVLRPPSLETVPISVASTSYTLFTYMLLLRVLVFGHPPWWCELDNSLIYMPS